MDKRGNDPLQEELRSSQVYKTLKGSGIPMAGKLAEGLGKAAQGLDQALNLSLIHICSIRPAWSSEMPSSRSEQHMPWDSTPAMAAQVISCPATMPPSLTKGTIMPSRTLGAPQTTS